MDVSGWSRGRWWSVVVLLSAVVLALDFLTGPYIQFPITFVFPVVLAGGFLGRRPAIVLATVLTSVRFGMVLAWEAPGFGFAVGLVNAGIRLVVLVLLGVLVDQISRQQRMLAQRVQVLEGLLPICCFCKSIRNAAGTWERLETYISGHTPAKFSHGFCEPCAKKHYPEVFGRPGEESAVPGAKEGANRIAE